MMASHGLLLETTRAEANHAQVKNKIDDLARQHVAQEQQALAELDDKVSAINAQFEKQRAEIAGQLQQSLRESIEKVLSQNRDHEISVLRRTHQERANERKKLYDEQKRKYDQELFAAITALMSLGVSHGQRPIICHIMLIRPPARIESCSCACISITTPRNPSTRYSACCL
jgi:exonuclease VII large subunit